MYNTKHKPKIYIVVSYDFSQLEPVLLNAYFRPRPGKGTHPLTKYTGKLTSEGMKGASSKGS